MVPLKAVVKNGRIVVDTPTDLPDGTELDLVPTDDALTAEEEAGLIKALESVRDGRGIDGATARELLLARAHK